MDTPSLMQSMAQLVSEGAFAAAVDLGKTGDPPLSVSLPEMAPAAGEVARGPNSVVTMGTFRNRRVAIKKPRLPTSTELERFKKELRLMARCSHPSVLPVVAAKLLPPDYLLVTPLYRGLKAQGDWGEPIARRIFEKAKPGYHPVTVGAVTGRVDAQ